MLSDSPTSPSISLQTSVPLSTLSSIDSTITPSSIISNSSFSFSPISPVSPVSPVSPTIHHNDSSIHKPIKHVKQRHAIQRVPAKPTEVVIVNIRLISPYFSKNLLSMILTDIMVLYFNETISTIKNKYNKSKIKIRFNGQDAVRFSFIAEKDKLHAATRETLSSFKNLYFEQQIYLSVLHKYCAIIDAMKEDAVIVYPQSVTFKDLINARQKVSFEGMITQYQNIFQSASIQVSTSKNINNKAALTRIVDKYLREKIKHVYTFKEMLSTWKQWFIADPHKYYNSLFFSLYGVKTIKDYVIFEVFNELMIWKKKMMGISVNFDSFVNNLLDSSLEVIKRLVVSKITDLFRKEIGDKLKTFWKQIRNRSYWKQREAKLTHIITKIDEVTKNDVLLFNTTNSNQNQNQIEKTDVTNKTQNTLWMMTNANINEYKSATVSKARKCRSRSFIIKGQLQSVINDQ